MQQIGQMLGLETLMAEFTIHSEMKITYCKRWSRFRKCMTEIWNAEKARKAHERGDLYTVLLGDPEKPTCFLEVHLKLGYIGVNFLDEYLRDYFQCGFTKEKPGMLFLSQVTHREYEAETDTVIEAKFARFFPDGRAIYEIDNTHEDALLRKEVEQEDLSVNWEPIPEFGQYESIARFERKHT
jgi:hypothetical protein